MPAYYLAGQFPAWGRLLLEKPRRQWEWRRLAFAALAVIRPPCANGCRGKQGGRERRARLPRRGLRFGAGLPGESEIQPDSVAWPALRSLLARGSSSHFPRSASSFPLTRA